jgi:hypothetical protein
MKWQRSSRMEEYVDEHCSILPCCTWNAYINVAKEGRYIVLRKNVFLKITKLKQAILCKYFSNIITKLTLISILRH